MYVAGRTYFKNLKTSLRNQKCITSLEANTTGNNLDMKKIKCIN
jgi:hypothetical protein